MAEVTVVDFSTQESQISVKGIIETVTPMPMRKSIYPNMFGGSLPPRHINRKRVFALKPSNPIPLYRSYVGKYPNAIYRQADLQMSVLQSELKNLLSKVSQLGARLSSDENLTFFKKLSTKARELLNKSTEDTHSAIRAIIHRLIAALHIPDKVQRHVHSLANFRASLNSPHSFTDEEEVHAHNLTLMKPAVHALKYLTRRLEFEGKRTEECLLAWNGAAALVRLVGEARYKVALLEELYQSYQAVYDMQFPLVRFLRRNSSLSMFDQHTISDQATTKERLGYIKKMVRGSSQSHSTTSLQSSFISQSMIERQKRSVEKALERGISMSRNEALESAVRRIFSDKEKLQQIQQKRIYRKHKSVY